MLGSYFCADVGKGISRGGSDIDLLIVAPTVADRHRESVAITDAIGDVRYPVDVKVISSERFEATKNSIGGIAYPANKCGRLLYRAVCAGQSTNGR